METQDNLNSEVARFLQRWDEEMDAMRQALSGYAITARHEFISKRIQTFGDAKMGELMALVAQSKTQNPSSSADNPR